MYRSSSLLTYLLIIAIAVPAFAGQPIPPDDMEYLRTIMRDTWRYIDFFVSPETGLPYDSNEAKDITNTTNVGLYLASISMAYKLGYIEEEEAIAKIEKILDSLDKYEHWNRLYTNWLIPEGENWEAKAGDNNISDYNKLPAGVMVVRQTFPELSERCTRFLDEIPWGQFHHPETDGLYYAFDVKAREMRHPVHFFRGEDKALGQYMAIGSGQVPPSTWEKQNLATEDKYGLTYYQYGWQGGGLFMHFICGLFMDNRGTSLGKSAANFAWAQMIHANEISSPVWGWSACVAPSGKYLGMGAIADPVVTPHASALAVNLFPQEVVTNLRRLEAMGLREPYPLNGKEYDFGFRDAVDWRSGAITDKFLVLDQAMLYLSLVNFCEDGLLLKTFGKDPIAQRAQELIPEYASAGDSLETFQEYLDSLTYDKPGVFWVRPEGDDSLKLGTPISRELWARSLSTKTINDCKVAWQVTDGEKRKLHRGAHDIEIGPRETRKIAALEFPTDKADYGTSWTLSSVTRCGETAGGSYDENLRFRSYKDLSSGWRVSQGDEEEWASVDFDDSGWATASVPMRWEDDHFQEYDGIGWYRMKFSVSDTELARWGDRPIAIAFGAIDDADITYLNGWRIGSGGTFPPDGETAYNEPRLYEIDRDQLVATNVLAVRVADWGGNGGIWRGPIAIGSVDELRDALELQNY